MSFQEEYADVKAFIKFLSKKVSWSLEKAGYVNRVDLIERSLTYHMIRAFQEVPKNVITFKLPKEAVIQSIEEVDKPTK